MLLGRDIFTELGLNLKWSDHVIKLYGGTFKGSTTTMVYLVTYGFKYLSTVEITVEESLTNA